MHEFLKFIFGIKIYMFRTVLLTPWSQAVSKSVWHTPLLCVQWKIPDGGQRNCPKHVEFYSKNKFEKLVHLFGFITRTQTLFQQYSFNNFILDVNKISSILRDCITHIPLFSARRWHLRAGTRCCKLFKIIVNYGGVRLYLLLLYLLEYSKTGMPNLKIKILL